MFNNFYWLFNKTIPEYICDKTLQEINWQKSNKGSVALKTGGQGIDKKVRNADIVFYPQLNPIWALLDSHTRYANEVANWKFDLSLAEDLQIARYEKSGHYDWHIDASMPNQINEQRKLSVIALLNDPSEFEGGNLEIDGVFEQPKLEKGSILIFPSILRHRITKITNGIRYSAFTWIYGKSFK